jgi:hypothetical protein
MRTGGENCVGIHASIVNAAGGSTVVRSPQPRARSRFRSELTKLPLRVARAVGLGTIAPDEDPQSSYLSALSDGKMKSTEVLWELMNFLGNDKNTAPDLKQMKDLSDSQLYSIYRNFKEHGELIDALQEFIARKAAWDADDRPTDDQQEILDYLDAMCLVLKEPRIRSRSCSRTEKSRSISGLERPSNRKSPS